MRDATEVKPMDHCRPTKSTTIEVWEMGGVRYRRVNAKRRNWVGSGGRGWEGKDERYLRKRDNLVGVQVSKPETGLLPTKVQPAVMDLNMK